MKREMKYRYRQIWFTILNNSPAVINGTLLSVMATVLTPAVDRVRCVRILKPRNRAQIRNFCSCVLLEILNNNVSLALLFYIMNFYTYQRRTPGKPQSQP